MKSAKKLLSLLLCAVMLLSVAPLSLSRATAAGSPGISVIPDFDTNEGTVTLHVYLENCVGITDAEFTVDYDPAILTPSEFTLAADAIELNSFNRIREEDYLNTPGKWRFFIAIENSLLSANEYIAQDEDVNFDPNHFGLFDIVFEESDHNFHTAVEIRCTSETPHMLSGANKNIVLSQASLPAPEIHELELNKEYTVTPIDGDEVKYKFVAPFTGDFVFYSYNETGDYQDTKGCFYNSEMVQIKANDNGGENGHFRLACTLTEGETYYFGARNYNYGITSFCVKLEHDHDYTVNPVTPATCAEEGLNHCVCNICGYETDEPVEKTQHTDLNPRDGICDRCHSEIGIETSGSFDDFRWELLGDGTLRIIGKGEFSGLPFMNRTDITRVEIGEGITSVVGLSFLNDSSLTDVVLPASLQRIDTDMFYECVNLKAYTVDPANPVYASQDGVLYNKDKTTLISYPRNRAGDSFTVPASVTALADRAFADTAALTSITFPAGLTSVGYRVFENSGWYLAQPDGPIYLGKVFLHYKGKAADTAFTVKEGTVSLASGAFSPFYGWSDDSSSLYDYAGITTVNLPDSLEEIGESAFSNFETIKTVNFGSKLKTVGAYAFFNCRALEKASLPNSVTSLGAGAFSSCESLSAFNVPTGISGLPAHVFGNCRALTSVTVPGNVKTIGFFAFSGCDHLKEINYAGSADDWKKIAIGEYNDVLKTVKINYGVAAHTHVAGKAMRENDVAPTCTAKGSYESVTYCTVCKQEMSRTKISVNALGHKWGPGQQTIAPTAEHEGELTSICTVCGATKKDPIPKLISTAQFRETENVVYAVPKQTPAQLLTLAGSGAKLTDQKGDPVPANGKIGSGMVLTRANGRQEVIVVKGDTTGDGEIKADDARYVLRAAVKLETPNTWQKDASTISSTNGKISASDARMILRAAVSLEKPENWLKK